MTKAHYLAEKIASLDGYELAFQPPFFKEFAIKTTIPAKQVVEKLMDKKIFAGVPLSRFGMDENLLLIAVTEKKMRTELDALVDALQEVNNG
jgi:glycine dehydrogenase subunit 1